MQYRTIGESDLDSLLDRIKDVKDIGLGLGLDGEDIDLIVNIVQSYALMLEKLSTFLSTSLVLKGRPL